MAKPKRVTKETIHKIRSLYAGGEWTQQKLAKRFKLSQSTICKIINNYIHRDDVVLTGKAEVRIGYKHGD